MNTQQAIEHFGGGNLMRAAREIGVTRQTLYNWQKRGIPALWQEVLSNRSHGALTPDTRNAPAIRDQA